jgi:hypothetical protein
VSDQDDERGTVNVEELALSNSVTLTALVELLEERGVISREEVLVRAKLIVNRRNPDV